MGKANEKRKIYEIQQKDIFAEKKKNYGRFASFKWKKCDLLRLARVLLTVKAHEIFSAHPNLNYADIMNGVAD